MANSTVHGRPFQDAALQAFRRLLSDAAVGGQAKVDALLALSQRTVWVTSQEDGTYRTLINTENQTGLAVFTSENELRRASAEYGWMDAKGEIDAREIGAREALRYAMQNEMDYVVVDVGAGHCVEMDKSEIEPLLTSQARREDSTGPFAVKGRLSSTLIQAVKPAPSYTGPALLPDSRPLRASTLQGIPVAAAPVVEPRIKTPIPRSEPPLVLKRPVTGSTLFADPMGVVMGPLHELPTDALLDTLSEVLRSYPEVEWACLGMASRGQEAARLTLGIRVDSAFRSRLSEIAFGVVQAAEAQSCVLEVMLMDDPVLLRSARTEALVFYPWRR